MKGERIYRFYSVQQKDAETKAGFGNDGISM
jgi:hypothetical protein